MVELVHYESDQLYLIYTKCNSTSQGLETYRPCLSQRWATVLVLLIRCAESAVKLDAGLHKPIACVTASGGQRSLACEVCVTILQHKLQRLRNHIIASAAACSLAKA